MSGISKCTFSDEVVTRSDMSAAESDSIAEESPSSFVSLSARGNPLLHSSSKSLRSRGGIAGNSRTKDLKHNDAHDEGSGIGKCGSSIEADMEAMTNVGPASSHAYPQIIESQVSVVNSSSTNALISDALSNTFNVRKPSVEADTTLRAVQGGEDLRENQVTVKRGKKPLKRRYLHGMFVEHVGKDNISWTKKNGTVMPHKRPILSDDTYQLSSTNGLKCKRWGSKFNPDFQSTKLRRVSSETFCYDREQTVQWQGPEPVVNPSEETRQIFRSNVAKYARVVSTPKPVNYQDAASNFSMRKASSKSKPNLELQGMKVIKNMVIGRKTGPDIHDLKAAKMVSLSSILEFPKANATFHNKNCGISSLLPSNVSHYKEMNSQGLQIWRTASTHIYPERICCDASTGVEGLKLGSWTTAVKSRHHVLEVPITWVKNSKQIEFSLQEDIQKHTMQGCTIIGESSRSLDADEFEKKMITIPVKFISQKRIATEDLLKEAEDIVVSVGHDGVSGKPVKQLKSQGVYSELKSCSLISDSEKGSISSHEKSECMGTGRKKKHRKHPNCPNTKIKKKPLMICCVCGVSSGETNNSLVKCSRCDLVVHRACYGILQESKKSWVCRPCKDHAINSVCVLCGYGGGAMTRAKKSEALMKSLRQAWQEENDNKEIISCELNISNPSSSNESHECGGKDTKSNENVQNMFKKDEHIQEEDEPCKKEGLCVNSVLDAVDDPTVTQWVHVVCALWMPGTRCMNVRTMAGFDVSRVPSHRRKLVCSICKRAGGACIKCREPKCGIAFHPWCAHKKGLLQNEAFGGADDKVGFFGRCMLHGMVTDATCKEIEEKAPLQCRSDNHSSTCARTEGGYTRRGETSFGPLGVSREEVAAWLSIKEHKTYARRFIKLDSSDSELYKREYIRFIQDQRWKRLAVYKSNIHALGLYTSVFIARGEMVAEYVGEVVGLRMADKREAEYLSNKRLQYKGACYLFRIDDENIIDATRKGGIARFVNHSCSPNCVAKIISIGDQKKVVFFAEKDIAPGEELTYDYKLDFENENRIPCYCKSDQCRGYLN